MEKKEKFGGFAKLIRQKMKKRKEEEKEKKTGRPSWVNNLSSSEKRRWEAVHKANKKKDY